MEKKIRSGDSFTDKHIGKSEIITKFYLGICVICK